MLDVMFRVGRYGLQILN